MSGKNEKGFATLLVFISIIILAGVLIYTYTSIKNRDPVVDNSSSNTDNTTETKETEQPNKELDSNFFEAADYSLTYPADWKTTAKHNSTDYTIPTCFYPAENPEFSTDNECENDQELIFVYTTVKNNSETSLSEYKSDINYVNPYNDSLTYSKEITLGSGLKALELKVSYTSTETGNDRVGYFWRIRFSESEESYLEVKYVQNSKDESYETVVREILDSIMMAPKPARVQNAALEE